MIDIATLAKALHESGREAVLANKVHKPDGAPVGQIVFKEWSEITEDAREGRRIQARWLLDHFQIYPLDIEYKIVGGSDDPKREENERLKTMNEEARSIIKDILLCDDGGDFKYIANDALEFFEKHGLIDEEMARELRNLGYDVKGDDDE